MAGREQGIGGRGTAHHRPPAEHRPVLWPVGRPHGGRRDRRVHGDQQRRGDLRGGRTARRHPSDQRRAADGDAVRGRPAREGRRPPPQRRRRRALPGRRQARLHGPLDHLHQAAVDPVGPAGRAPAHQGPQGDGLDRDLHRGRRAALPRRDLLDRPGRRPPLRPPGRSFGPQAHHGYRRRLGRLLHRRRQGACRASAPWCSTCRWSARWRATSSPPTASPTASRPRPATSRAIRSRPIATSPSWPPTCRCTAAT